MILSRSGFGDEAIALLRVLIEVVVNGAYLMVTGDKEFVAFTAHPLVMMAKHHKAYNKHSGNQSSFTQDFNQSVETGATEAAALSGRTMKDSSWTSESVYKRAVIADQTFNDSDFATLAATVYVDGHDFIHGTFPGIVNIIGEFEGETMSEEEAYVYELPTPNGATLALLGYALALNQHFKTNLDSELGQIIFRYAHGGGTTPS